MTAHPRRLLSEEGDPPPVGQQAQPASRVWQCTACGHETDASTDVTSKPHPDCPGGGRFTAEQDSAYAEPTILHSASKVEQQTATGLRLFACRVCGHERHAFYDLTGRNCVMCHSGHYLIASETAAAERRTESQVLAAQGASGEVPTSSQQGRLHAYDRHGVVNEDASMLEGIPCLQHDTCGGRYRRTDIPRHKRVA